MRVRLGVLVSMVWCACDGSYTGGGRPKAPISAFGVDTFAGCLVDRDDDLWCWGDAIWAFPGQPSAAGEDVICVDPFTPAAVAQWGVCVAPKPMRPEFAAALGDSSITQISMQAGWGHCLLDDAGQVWCGPASYTGVTEADCPECTISVTSGDLAIAQLEVGVEGWCGVTTDGEGYCFLSRNETTPKLVRIPGDQRFRSISFRSYTYVGLDDDGLVWKGRIERAQGSTELAPGAPALWMNGQTYLDARVATTSTYNDSGPDLNICLLSLGGMVTCVGNNASGELGNGTWGGTWATSYIQGLDATQIAVGDSHVCALGASGDVWCWGSNYSGELGAVAASTCDISNWLIPCSTTPLKVEGVPKAVAVWAGNDITCVEGEDGSVWCLGNDSWGATGTNTGASPNEVVGPG